MIKANAHFVDCGLDDSFVASAYESNNYGSFVRNPAKIAISTMADLSKIGNDPAYPRTGDYELVNNIDGTGVAFVPICTVALPFEGTIEGNYFTIRNISIDAANGTASFFRYIDTVTITNLTIENMAITNAGSSCALLASTSFGTSIVTNVHVQGSISGGDSCNAIGGMFSTTNADMNICSADVNITSSRDSFSCGGLVHTFGGTMTNCYAKGIITGTYPASLYYTGGLIGIASGTSKTYQNCYSSVKIVGTPYVGLGKVGGMIGDGGTTPTYTSNYWDGTLSPTLNDVGDDGNVSGITKSTTTNMYQQATYVGWDFNTIWAIDEGNAYPHFRWQDNRPYLIIKGQQNRITKIATDYTHIEAELIQALGNGSYLGTEVVASGAIALDDATTVNHVGLPYTSKILPMKIDGEVAVKRVRHIVLNVNNSLGGHYGRLENDLNNIVLKTTGDVMDTDGALYTGHVELPFDGRYDRQGDIFVTQDKPLPMRIVGMSVSLSNEDV